MITKMEAVTAMIRQEFHMGDCVETIGPRGGVTRKQFVVRVTGRCQTWITRPEEFRLPIRHGLKSNGAITQDNAHEFHHPGDCPVNK